MEDEGSFYVSLIYKINLQENYAKINWKNLRADIVGLYSVHQSVVSWKDLIQTGFYFQAILSSL